MNDDIDRDRDGLDVDEEADGAASLAELQARRMRAGLTAGGKTKAGDITDLLASIDLDDPAATHGAPAGNAQRPTAPLAHNVTATAQLFSAVSGLGLDQARQHIGRWLFTD